MLAEPSLEIMTEEEDGVKEAVQDRYADVENFCSELVGAETNKDGEDSNTYSDMQQQQPAALPPTLVNNVLDYVALKHYEEGSVIWWLVLAQQGGVF